MGHPEIRQGVVIDLFQPTEPLEGRFLAAATLNLSGRTNPPTVGIDPKADQQSRVPWGSACHPFDRCDRPIEPLQV